MARSAVSEAAENRRGVKIKLEDVLFLGSKGIAVGSAMYSFRIQWGVRASEAETVVE